MTSPLVHSINLYRTADSPGIVSYSLIVPATLGRVSRQERVMVRGILEGSKVQFSLDDAVSRVPHSPLSPVPIKDVGVDMTQLENRVRTFQDWYSQEKEPQWKPAITRQELIPLTHPSFVTGVFDNRVFDSKGNEIGKYERGGYRRNILMYTPITPEPLEVTATSSGAIEQLGSVTILQGKDRVLGYVPEKARSNRDGLPVHETNGTSIGRMHNGVVTYFTIRKSPASWADYDSTTKTPKEGMTALRTAEGAILGYVFRPTEILEMIFPKVERPRGSKNGGSELRGPRVATARVSGFRSSRRLRGGHN